MVTIHSLDIEPTSHCNLNCPFCFGPEITSLHDNNTMNLDKWKFALHKFKLLGVKNIVVSGGEPLLYKNISELLSYLNFLGYNTMLSTNGRIQNILFDNAKYCILYIITYRWSVKINK